MLENMVQHKPRLERGENLYRAGSRLKALYTVRSGSFKTVMLTRDGAEQVTGFHFPGELLGLDGFNDERHGCTAVALESATVCAITMDDFASLCGKIANLRRQLMHLVGREINQDHEILMALGQMKGEERLATFLLNLSRRLEERGFSPSEFNLTMTRHDLANYLGLAVETLSRMFSRMQEDHVLSANRRHIKILDEPRLKVLAHHCCRNNC